MPPSSADHPFTPPTFLKVGFLILVAGCSAIACQQTSDSGLQAPAQFTWRGWVYDSMTGTPIDDFRITVREQAEHDSVGWKPGGVPEYFAGGRFAFTYVLWEFQCQKAVDTTIAVHLDFLDPSGQHQPATHTTLWILNCDNLPPPGQAPPAIEDSLRILLVQ